MFYLGVFALLQCNYTESPLKLLGTRDVYFYGAFCYQKFPFFSYRATLLFEINSMSS